jgi:hypothetical protein
MFYILRFLLILALFLSGYLLSKKKSSDYKFSFNLAIFPILFCYTFIEGLRYNRGTDYISYKQSFISSVKTNYEPIFNFIIYIFNLLNFHYSIYFVLFSFILIYSCCFILNEIRFISLFALPLFFLTTIVQSENLVRMYLSISFLLLGISFLLKNNIYITFLFFILAFFTHYSIGILLPFIYLFNRFENPFKSINILIILYFLAFIFPPSIQTIYFAFNNVSNIFSLNDGYFKSTDRWILGIGLKKNLTETFSPYFYFRFHFTNLVIIIIGHSLFEYYRKYKISLFYHLSYIGLILIPTANILPTEIFYRITLFFTLFNFLILSFILHNLTINFLTNSLIYKLVYFYLIFDITYLLIKSIFIFDDLLGNKFIWDA